MSKITDNNEKYVDWSKVEEVSVEKSIVDFFDSAKECVEIFFDHFYNVPEEPTEEQIKEMMEQQEKRKDYEEKRLEEDKEVRDILVSKFDELFTEHIKYDKKRDKNYYEYIFDYGHVWSDGDHLVIANDVRDSFEEFELERVKKESVLEWQYQNFDDLGFCSLYEMEMMDNFTEWFFEEMLAYENEEDRDNFESDDSLLLPYLKEVIRSLRGDDIFSTQEDSGDKSLEEMQLSHKVSKDPMSWSFFRRCQENGEEYETKEKAFEGYLADSSYGLDDLTSNMDGSEPEWLEELLNNI
jgi:hypothetical protein